MKALSIRRWLLALGVLFLTASATCAPGHPAGGTDESVGTAVPTAAPAAASTVAPAPSDGRTPIEVVGRPRGTGPEAATSALAAQAVRTEAKSGTPRSDEAEKAADLTEKHGASNAYLGAKLAGDEVLAGSGESLTDRPHTLGIVPSSAAARAVGRALMGTKSASMLGMVPEQPSPPVDLTQVELRRLVFTPTVLVRDPLDVTDLLGGEVDSAHALYREAEHLRLDVSPFEVRYRDERVSEAFRAVLRTAEVVRRIAETVKRGPAGRGR